MAQLPLSKLRAILSVGVVCFAVYSFGPKKDKVFKRTVKKQSAYQMITTDEEGMDVYLDWKGCVAEQEGDIIYLKFKTTGDTFVKYSLNKESLEQLLALTK